MTSILPNVQNVQSKLPMAPVNNTAAPTALLAPAPTNGMPQQTGAIPSMPQGQPQMQVNPQFTNLLTTGGLASVLGALWANPKIQSAGELLNLADKKYDSAVKKVKNSATGKTKTHFDSFDTFRKSIPNAVTRMNKEYFNTADSIDLKSLLSTAKANNIEELGEQIKNSKLLMEKQTSALALLDDFRKSSGKITGEITEKLNKLYTTEDITKNPKLAGFKNALITNFKEEITGAEKDVKIVNKLLNFVDQYRSTDEKELEKLLRIERLARCAGEDGKITKTAAEKVIKDFAFEDIIDSAKSSFEGFKQKLPKARLKNACKWFGLGIGISIATRFIFGLFRGKNDKH